MKYIIVFISGSEVTEFTDVIDATQQPQESSTQYVQISLVVSNKSRSKELERAKSAGIPYTYVYTKDYRDKNPGSRARKNTMLN
jgi:folate-dependent phosphoribosylglycinamide formyltransferase PurN